MPKRPARPTRPASRSSRPLLGRLFRRSGRTRGQSVVEFALILPVFLLLFGTTLDLGRIAAARVTVENAAREGAFEAASNDATFDSSHGWVTTNPWNPSTNPCNRTTDSVTCRALLESRAGSVVSIAPADVQMTCNPSCTSGMGNRSTVTVSGRMTLLTPILRPFFGGGTVVNFTAASTTQIETLPLVPGAPTPSPTSTPTPNPSPTATPVPTPTPTVCGLPSAGFTYSLSPKSGQAPVTLSVTDTSTYIGPSACAINRWWWDWGDNTGSDLAAPAPRSYVAKGSYDVTLTVWNVVGQNTSGKVKITVK